MTAANVRDLVSRDLALREKNALAWGVNPAIVSQTCARFLRSRGYEVKKSNVPRHSRRRRATNHAAAAAKGQQP
jgi:hypothetical protein